MVEPQKSGARVLCMQALLQAVQSITEATHGNHSALQDHGAALQSIVPASQDAFQAS
jgi:hypothetical protein